jgi:hypothetical protein
MEQVEKQVVRVANLVIIAKKAVQKVIKNQQHQHYLVSWSISAIIEVKQKFRQKFIVGLRACPPS